MVAIERGVRATDKGQINPFILPMLADHGVAVAAQTSGHLFLGVLYSADAGGGRREAGARPVTRPLRRRSRTQAARGRTGAQPRCGPPTLLLTCPASLQALTLPLADSHERREALAPIGVCWSRTSSQAGWSEEIDGLHLCPACRERIVADR